MPPVVVGVAAAVGAYAAGAAVVFVGGAVITGIAAAAFIGVATAIGVEALKSALTPDLPNGTVDPEADQQVRSGGVTARKIVYGEAVIGAQLIGYAKFEDPDQDNKDFHLMVLNIAGHPSESLEIFEIEGKEPSELGSKVTPTFYLGDQTSVDPLANKWIEGWSTDHIGYNQTYAVLLIEIDNDLFPAGINEIKFKIKGKKCYDPRKDTSAGGSGSHRPNSQSTWEWTDNSALIALDYARFYGYKEQPIRRFDFDYVASTANYCDELVDFTDRTGSQVSEKRFTCNGILNNALRPSDGLNNIMSTMAAKPYRIGGKIYIKPSMYSGPATIVLLADNAVSLNKYRPHRPEKERTNTIRCRYVEPDKKYQFTDAAVVSSAGYIAADGKVLEQDIRLPMTNSETMAQRICHLALERNRAGFAATHVEDGLRLDLTPGRSVRLSDADNGITNKEFLVEMVQFNTSKNRTEVALIEEGPAIYPDNINVSQSDLTPNTRLDDDLVKPINLRSTDIYDGVHQVKIQWDGDYYNYIVRIDEVTYDEIDPLLVLTRVQRVNQWVYQTNEYLIQNLRPADYILTVQARDRLGRVSRFSDQFAITITEDILFTWRVWADDELGTNISDTDSSLNYYGILFGQYTDVVDTSDPSKFVWFPNTAAQWITGNGAPSNALGLEGWTYVDLDTGDIYRKNGSGTWDGPIGNISGGDGDEWLSGPTNPTLNDGQDGDLWLNTTTYELFQKVAGTWETRGIIKGEDGEAVTVVLVSDRGFFFKNNTGNVKTITANVYLNGVLSSNHASYKYTWTSNGQQMYVNNTADFIGFTNTGGTYPANPYATGGLNFQSIKIDFSDVPDGDLLNIQCEITDI